MPPRRRSSRMNMERVHLLKEQVYSFFVLYWSKYLTLNLHFHSHGILQEFFSDLLQPEGAIEARRREIKKAKGSKAQNKDMQFFEPVYDNQINLWYQVIIKSISRKCSWIETAPNRIMGLGAFDFELRSKSHEPVPHMHNPHRLPGFLIRGSHRIRSHQRVGGAVQSWSCQCWVIKLSFLRLVKKKMTHENVWVAGGAGDQLQVFAELPQHICWRLPNSTWGRGLSMLHHQMQMFY